MEFSVIKQTIALIQDETLIRRSEKTYTTRFTFDETWDGFTKTAHFQAGPTASSVELVDNACSIPSECLENAGVILKVYVTGVKDGKEQATDLCMTSRILYDAVDDILSGVSSGGGSGTSYTGEVGRLCDDFADALNDGYTEGELKDKTLSEVVGEMDGLGNTATDAEVEAALNDVWGAE